MIFLFPERLQDLRTFLTDGLQPRAAPSPAARHELRGGRDSGAGAGTSGQTAMAIRMPRQGKNWDMVACPKVEMTRISMEIAPWRYIQQIVILYIYIYNNNNNNNYIYNNNIYIL